MIWMGSPSVATPPDGTGGPPLASGMRPRRSARAERPLAPLADLGLIGVAGGPRRWPANVNAGAKQGRQGAVTVVRIRTSVRVCGLGVVAEGRLRRPEGPRRHPFHGPSTGPGSASSAASSRVVDCFWCLRESWPSSDCTNRWPGRSSVALRNRIVAVLPIAPDVADTLNGPYGPHEPLSGYA